MSSTIMALIAFACIFGGALFGLFLRVVIPEPHLSDNSKDVIKLGAGLLATLAALVLGLLISTAKNSLDTYNTELAQASATVIVLDRVLASYGPETKEVRDQLRDNLATTIELVWPSEKSGKARVDSVQVAAGIERIQHKLRVLSPQNDSQRLLKSRALEIANQLAQGRWLLIMQTQTPLPKVFLIVLVSWLTMLFISFGMLTPCNTTVMAVLLICALSVTGAIFLILEMNTPLTGIIKVSDAPMRKALEHLGK